MYIIAIAWLYVALMIAVTSRSVTAGVLSFLFYGVLPLGLLLWLMGGPRRRKSLPPRGEDDEPPPLPDAATGARHPPSESEARAGSNETPAGANEQAPK
jgi:hypothetical protein